MPQKGTLSDLTLLLHVYDKLLKKCSYVGMTISSTEIRQVSMLNLYCFNFNKNILLLQTNS
jgi:hypothetical protein